MTSHLFNSGRVEMQVVVFFNAQIGDADLLPDLETGVFKRFRGTSYGTAVDSDDQLARPGRLDHSRDMPPNPG